MKTRTLDLPEIQGLLASGYQKQRAGCYVLLRIIDPAAARGWLAGLIPRITFCGDQGPGPKLNIALSYRALEGLGGDQSELAGFSREYREGMVTPHRQRVLGDLPGSRSDPEAWLWGGPRAGAAEVLVMVFEGDTPALEARLTALRADLRGLEILRELPTSTLQDDREHFGFRDGIARLSIRELGRPDPERDRVAAGEFLLGYADETGEPEPAPALAQNGSYLVFRQIVQDVAAFWGYFGHLADDREKITLAAKMMGRWPDGTPLTLAPDADHAADPSNDFTFREHGDGEGLRCPLGAHIRRANPRDGLLADGAQSMRLVNRHRLLRRGRLFGPPAPPEVFPPGYAVTAEEAGVPGPPDLRGVYFICLGASLARQFEFVQQTWLNNPKFQGLSNETDPIVGPVRWSGPDEEPTFTAPAHPVRTRVAVRPTFVHTVGGEYFFLPGKAALHLLATGRPA